MSNADASEHGSVAARARWGNQVVSRAVSVVVERRDELDAPLIDKLDAAIAAARARDGEDAR